tara:strand:- start:2254 stop:3942 length:1689 start_codon:yes stop_codon:yes gene_type:complete
VQAFSATTLAPDTLRDRAALQEYEGFGQRSGSRAHTEYQKDPMGWIHEKLGVPEHTLRWSLNDGYAGHDWDGTVDPLAGVLEALAEWKDVGVESGTGTGKTFLGAAVVLWFLACWEDSIVVTAAPKLAQLTKHIWKEIGVLWPRFLEHFPEAELLASGAIHMRPGIEERESWAATAFGCGVGAAEASATKAQGWHAEHMLILTEETPGVHPAIMVAFENTCSAPHNLRLAFGNPDFEEDELHQFCLQPHVTHVRVSALDHPNVVADESSLVPGAVSKEAIERRRDLYAHIPAMYQSRVRGISPKQATGVALGFVESDHMEHSPMSTLIEQGWPMFAGIDFGAWRFCFVLAASDRTKRLHVLAEHFSQQETLTVRAKAIHELLTKHEAPSRTPIWGDSANPQDIMELNAAFRKLGSPYLVRAVAKTSTEGKNYRAACVERLNDLLGRRALLFCRELGKGQKWYKGASVASEGRMVGGSRLLWEVRNWRYPDRREGRAQHQDADDNTADGADAIAALRYLVMSWWKAASFSPPPEKVSRNRDTGLEDRLERVARHERQSRRHPF